ncbi:MAG: hypothetical protein IT291_06015 [Deltaproteobacteria bacterium]|nr:hypothetical protein [Deltaproteobacteria bacterium]
MSYLAYSAKESFAEPTSTPKASTRTRAKVSAPSTEYINDLILTHRENGRKLARSLLRRWRARMNPQEVDSLVDLTLCETAKRFSLEHGASFMTFFYYHLRGYLVRAIASAVNSGSFIASSGEGANGESPERLSVGKNYYYFLPDEIGSGSYDNEGPECLLIRKENINLCRNACAQLDSLEQEVIVRSFEKEEALVDIARSLGYSRCHISRVKKRALERLTALLDKESIRPKSKTEKSNGLATRAAATVRQKGSRRSRRSNIRSRQFMSSVEMPLEKLA